MRSLVFALAALLPSTASAATAFVWGTGTSCTGATASATTSVTNSGRFASVGSSDLEIIPNFTGVDVVYYFSAPCGPPEPGIDQIAFGDALANYVDGGGSLVLLQFATTDQNAAIGVEGRLRTGGYLPWSGSYNFVGPPVATLGTHDASALWTGITTLSTGPNSWSNATVVAAPGAIVHGSWSDGSIAAMHKGRVLFVNAYPLLGLSGDVDRFLGNAGFAMVDFDHDGYASIDEDLNKNGDFNDDDTDLDGIKNYLDDDDDGDKLLTRYELAADSDGDGIVDYLDPDDDGDGVPTKDEDVDKNGLYTDDTDKDGKSNYLDADDDGDGAPTLAEDVNKNGNPQDDDTDKDGKPNYLDADDDGDGVISSAEDLNKNGNLADDDTDKDGKPNYLDDDDDGDGLLTVAEGLADTDSDGVPNYLDTDSDGDGTVDLGDCKPVDPAIHPGATEQCDLIDSNCNGSLVDTFTNTDTDALPDCVDTDDDGDGTVDLSDCKPLDAAIHPGATEQCDLIDSNCNGSLIDTFTNTDTDTLPDCVDTDDDGDGTVDLSDCKPLDAAIHPGATEQCDLIDSDCNGSLVDGFTNTDTDAQPDCVDTDDDGDGTVDANDCKPLDAAIHPGATELCDLIDSDCNGSLVDGFTNSDTDAQPDCVDVDDDGDGTADTADCKPLNAAVHPGATEVCDGLDNDCDTRVDNDPLDGLAFQLDLDGDGYGDPNVQIYACAAGGDATLDDRDCDDGDSSVHPGATDTPYDGIDSDCSGGSDNDVDRDGYDAKDHGGTDCDDTNATVYPGAPELNDGLDNNCDGQVENNDADGDGLMRLDELAAGTDPDDADSDHDTVPDGDEVDDPLDPIDTDADGVIDALDDDDDGDDIATATEVGADPTDPIDTDGDAIPDYLDTDSDGDGAADADEGEVDTDGDAIPDYRDADDDGDGFDEVDGDCDDAHAAINPDAVEVADGVDNNCDGVTDEGFEDADNDGVSVADGDCDDTDPNVVPGTIDTCDQIDNNCDGVIDEGDVCANVDDGGKGCACETGGGPPWLGGLIAAIAGLYVRRRR